MDDAAIIADRLDELRREMELRFSGEFVENAVNRLDAAANFLRQSKATRKEALKRIRAISSKPTYPGNNLRDIDAIARAALGDI